MASKLETGTAEAVAFELVRHVMRAENRDVSDELAPGWQRVDRKYLLDLYAECLDATQARRRSDAENPVRPAEGQGDWMR